MEVATGRDTRITDGAGSRVRHPGLAPGRARRWRVAGHRYPRGGGSRNDIWLFAADGCEARRGGGRNLSGRHDLMLARGHGQRRHAGRAGPPVVTPGRPPPPLHGAGPRLLRAVADRPRRRRRGAPDRGSPLPVGLARRRDARTAASGSRRSARPPRRSATSTSSTSAPTAGRAGATGALRRITRFNDDVLAEIDVRAPRGALGDRRRARDPGLAHPLRRRPSGASRRRSCSQIHGGPHTLYGWAPYWEFQVLAGRRHQRPVHEPARLRGLRRGLQRAPTSPTGATARRATCMAHVDALVAAGVADPARLGVTGGSYGGYLTNWIVGHSDRFAAAMTCRSVTDLTTPDAHRRPRRRHLRHPGVRRPAVGEARALPAALAADLRRRRSTRRC